MIYPNFLKENDTIGITALSAGVGHKIEDYEKSINKLKENGFDIYETENVRVDGFVSSSDIERAKQFNQLILNKDINMILCATGGDFLIEVLPYIDWKNIENNPKFIMGYSDPTSLLYVITTSLDIATLYGNNAGSFDQNDLHESLKNSIEIIKGNLVEQNSFDLYEREKLEEIHSYNLTEKVFWENFNCNEIEISGRIIGGCLDCIRNIIGTKYDNTSNFIEKYKEDGIIWYFDIFNISSEDLTGLLFQMKEKGYFNNTKGIIFGRVAYPNENVVTYQEAIQRIIKNIPVVFNADIGHVAPKMTIINGAIAKIKSKDGKGSIKFELK